MINNDIIEKDIYSTEETKTNKVWIDENGKKWPVYRKEINLGTLPNNSSKSVTTGLIHTEIRLREIYGRCYTSTGNYQGGLNDSLTRLLLKNDDTIEIITKDNFSVYTGIVTLEYTKTAD